MSKYYNKKFKNETLWDSYDKKHKLTPEQQKLKKAEIKKQRIKEKEERRVLKEKEKIIKREQKERAKEVKEANKKAGKHRRTLEKTNDYPVHYEFKNPEESNQNKETIEPIIIPQSVSTSQEPEIQTKPNYEYIIVEKERLMKSGDLSQFIELIKSLELTSIQKQTVSSVERRAGAMELKFEEEIVYFMSKIEYTKQERDRQANNLAQVLIDTVCVINQEARIESVSI